VAQPAAVDAQRWNCFCALSFSGLCSSSTCPRTQCAFSYPTTPLEPHACVTCYEKDESLSRERVLESKNRFDAPFLF